MRQSLVVFSLKTPLSMRTLTLALAAVLAQEPSSFAQSSSGVSLAPERVAAAYLGRRTGRRAKGTVTTPVATTSRDGAGAVWVSVPVTDNRIVTPTGRRVRATEIPAADLAEEENEISENARAPDALVLRDGHDYLLLVGEEDVIGKSDRPLNGSIAFAMIEDMTLRSRDTALEHTAADAPAISVGPEGPVSGRPVNRVTNIPFDPSATAALAFYISCDRDGRDAYDGLAGGGVTFHLGDVAQELSVGLRGSAPTSLGLFEFLSNPISNITNLQNGWFLSHRVAVRVLEFSEGSLSFIARGQVDQGEAGLGVMGWFGVSVAPAAR